MAGYNALDTVTLTDMAKTIYRSSLLQRIFFPKEITYMTEKFEVQYKKHSRALAPYVQRGERSKLYKQDETQVRVVEPGRIAEKIQITEEDLKKRQYGQVLFPAGGQESMRMADTIAEWIMELMVRQERTIELQASQILNTGQLTITGSPIIDFGRNAANSITLAGDNRWSQTTSDPLATMRQARKIASRASGINPNVCVMGATAWDQFTQRLIPTKYYDSIRANFGEIKDERTGVTESLHVHIPGIGDVYTYDANYVDSSGTNQNFIPDNAVFYGSPSAGAIHYGAIQSKETGGLVQTKMLLDEYIEPDPVAKYIRCRCYPIVVPVNTDNYVRITVS